MEIVQKLHVLDSLSLLLLTLTLHSLSRSHTHTHRKKGSVCIITMILGCCELLINFLVGRPGNVNKISVLSEPHFYSHLFWEATIYGSFTLQGTDNGNWNGTGTGNGVYCSHCSTGNGTGYSKNLLPCTGSGGEMGLEPICSLSLCSVNST